MSLPTLLLALAATTVSPAPNLRSLIETPDLSSPLISPDGRFVAYRRTQASVAHNALATSWWIARLGSTLPGRRIADGGPPLMLDSGVTLDEPPQWSPDSRWIYYRARANGAVQVWRAGRAGGGPAAVTQDPADVEAFKILDGRRLVYHVGATRAEVLAAETQEAMEGVRIDQTVDVAQSLLHGAFVNGRLAAQRMSGKWFGRTGLLGDRTPHFSVVDLTGHAARPAAQVERDEAVAFSSFERDAAPKADPLGRSVRRDSVDLRMLHIDGSPRNLTRGVQSHRFTDLISTFEWSPGRDAVLVTTRDRLKRQTLWLWNLQSDSAQPVAQADGLLSGGGSDAASPCAADTVRAVCVAAAPLVPPHLVSIDLDTGRLRTLDQPSSPPPTGAGVIASPLTWGDDLGHTFTGILILPASRQPQKPLPLFISYYDCSGFLRGGVGDEWPLAPLAAQGVAALCINQTADLASEQNAITTYQAALSGVRHIISRLSDQGVIDRRRVGMGGLSFGSEVTMWIVGHSNLLAAASIASPQLEPHYYWFNGVAGRTQHATLQKVWGLGDPDLTRNAWEQVSPALKTADIHTPILMQLVEQEFRYEMELYAKLSNSPLPVDMFVFPDEAHIKAQPAHRLAIYQRNIDWFRFWLADVVDPDPRKAEQYTRWIAQRQAWRRVGQASDQARAQSSTSAIPNSR